MTRLPDWNVRYHAFIESMRKVPFKWGAHDCGPAWAGEAVSVMTGQDNPLGKYKGKYKSLKGAISVMKDAGFSDLKELVAAELGEPVHPSMGYIGDIAVLHDESELKYSLGIVNGERVFFRTKDGIGTVDLLECDSIFKV